MPSFALYAMRFSCLVRVPLSILLLLAAPAVLCAQAHRGSAGEVEYDLYLPAAYEVDTRTRFPVVYWLHGSGGYPPGVVEMLAGRFRQAMDSGRIPPAIVVFLHDGSGRSLWLDDHAGKHP